MVWRSIRFFGSRIDKIADPALRKQVARNALHVIAKMVFEDGLFHADPHPGNIIMIRPEDAPVIGLIDLGLVGRLSEDLRDGAIRLLIAAATGDAAALADALLALGKPRGRVDVRAFRAEVAVVSEKYLGRPLKEIETSALLRVKRLAAKCAELVRTRDTGTLQYELYFNSDNTECLVFERYRDSQALLDHHKNLGDTMVAILQTCSGSGEICGTPSAELMEQLKDSPVQVYTPFLAA